jgi:hypothetical protein
MVVKRFADRPYVWRTVLPATKAQGKYVVEECLVLSIKELFDKGLLANHSFQMGSWRWADADISHFNGSVRYEADLRDHEKASLRLEYEIDGLPIDYSLGLSAVDLAMFGPRWWFRCPLEDVRVKKLYLPPQARRFASRKAYDLIYPSSRRKRSIEDCHLVVGHVKVLSNRDFSPPIEPHKLQD